MIPFKVTPTTLPEVLLVEVPIYRDDRGHFQEVWHRAKHSEAGLPERFVQDNLSQSRRGVVRGLHFQHPEPQGKLVCVLHGAIHDVVVDIRRGSPRFGQHAAVTLSAESGRQLYVPEGFAHGFAAVSETAIVLYKCTAPYNPKTEGSVLWSDPDLSIDWPVSAAEAIVSVKDAQAPRLAEIDPKRLPLYPP